MEFLANSTNDLRAIADDILGAFPREKIFLLEGEMGAGKTTLIKAICESLGVNEATSSPTFSIVNEYLADNHVIYHFDFYRLKDEQEAFDLGYEEYLYSGNYCFIEWPEKISNLLPEDCKTIEIEIINRNSRRITIL